MTDENFSGDDYAYFRIEGENGLAYVRHIHDSAERADKFMFEITRNNFLAVAALSTFGTASLIGITTNRLTVIVFVCAVIVAISTGAAILVFFHHRHSSHLYAKAWVAEKAWLRGKRSDRLLEAIRHENDAFKAARRRSGGIDATGRGLWRTSFYFWANVAPAIIGIILIIALSLGLIVIKAS